jgi:hypothetical protein
MASFLGGDEMTTLSQSRCFLLRSLVAGVWALSPGAGRAGVVDITVNPPDTITTQFTPGPHILAAGAPPFALPLTTPAVFTTPGGNFQITLGTLTAANAGGLLLAYAVTAKVTDLTGVKADVILRVSQAYAVNASIFAVLAPTMAATFVDAVDGTPHGNDVRAVLNIAGEDLDTFFAKDSGAPSGMTQIVAGVPVSSPPNIVTSPDPMNVTTPITFQFDVAPVAGDSIAIPIEFKVQDRALVPELPTWVMMLAGFIAIGMGAKLAQAKRGLRANSA